MHERNQRDGLHRRKASRVRAFGLVTATLGLSAFLSGCPAAGTFPGSAYLSAIDTTAPSIASLPDGTYTGEASVPVPLGSFAAAPYADRMGEINPTATAATKARRIFFPVREKRGK